MAEQPRIFIGKVPDAAGLCGVGVRRPGRLVLQRCRSRSLPESVLRVDVFNAESPGNDVPGVAGRYTASPDTLWFLPHFPFEPGLQYRATFDSGMLDEDSKEPDVLTLDFSIQKSASDAPPRVTHVFPSSDELPENILRFYVCFDRPMRRGLAQAEISILGPGAQPVPDVLYRAPVELWDSSMQCLTVLLDPGRLKRGVGPNRELGPPLTIDHAYTLSVGGRMADIAGGQLAETFRKRFRVIEAVRAPVALDQWTMAPPETGTCQPLALNFPRPLDWSLLLDTIEVRFSDDRRVSGRIVIGKSETQWSFVPDSPWAPGSYLVHVAPTLEDVCGNNLVSPFDRSIRRCGSTVSESRARSLLLDLV